jgi:ATP-binding cassette subfamily B protein
MVEAKREFRVADAHDYDRRGAWRWIGSHLGRYPGHLINLVVGTVIANSRNVGIALLTGAAFDEVLSDRPDRGALLLIALGLLGVVLVANATDLVAQFSAEVLGKRLERDARDELYASLLGKSQTFHNRQRVGDIMARATGDVRQINAMVVPGMATVGDSVVTVVATLIAVAALDWRLLPAPLLFVAGFVVTLRGYSRRLAPVNAALREQFGTTNAGLAEAVGGIEVVKSHAQEAEEERKFAANAGRFRDLYVQNGRLQALYLPLLLLAVATAGAFLHGAYLLGRGGLSVGALTAYIGLMGALRVPAGLSSWTINLIQLGIAASRRILAVLDEETELDERSGGHQGRIRGELVFEGVSFGYGDQPLLRDVSFRVAPGQTVAIVGQTGSGKSTLTKLVNRTYDVDGGRVLVDGVDVRDWSLDALRSQIATIEQDVFLFSRTVAANIAFGAGAGTDRAAIERAAKDARADGFIRGFRDGYETEVGERGVTLSGGQRQRLAIARALLTDPPILILDDATSAVDSATEDEIQLAIRRIQEGRTTLLITHRLSQIRWADKVLVLHGGRLIDEGAHGELLGRCDLYRRIFARHEPALTQPAATGTRAAPVGTAGTRSAATGTAGRRGRL